MGCWSPRGGTGHGVGWIHCTHQPIRRMAPPAPTQSIWQGTVGSAAKSPESETTREEETHQGTKPHTTSRATAEAMPSQRRGQASRATLCSTIFPHALDVDRTLKCDPAQLEACRPLSGQTQRQGFCKEHDVCHERRSHVCPRLTPPEQVLLILGLSGYKMDSGLRAIVLGCSPWRLSRLLLPGPHVARPSPAPCHR